MKARAHHIFTTIQMWFSLRLLPNKVTTNMEGQPLLFEGPNQTPSNIGGPIIERPRSSIRGIPMGRLNSYTNQTATLMKGGPLLSIGDQLY